MQNYMSDSWQRYTAVRFANEMCSYLPLEATDRFTACFDRHVAQAPQPAPADTMNSFARAGYILGETARGMRVAQPEKSGPLICHTHPTGGGQTSTICNQF